MDPHSFYVDPDPSILSFDADLLSGSDTGIWIQIQVGRNLSRIEKDLSFWSQKTHPQKIVKNRKTAELERFS